MIPTAKNMESYPERTQDPNEESIRISTDFIGKNPIFYMLTEDGICTSTNIAQLIRKKGKTATINNDALKMYLVFQYVPTEETIIKGIFRLPPGCTLFYSKAQGLRIERVPHPTFNPCGNDIEPMLARIRNSVSSAIAQEKPTIGKTGCFLSGGIDSSYLASVLKPDYTYTFAFGDPRFDEDTRAKRLSDMLGAESKRRVISSDEYLAAIPMVQSIIGQPYANPSGVPLYYLAELASEDNVPVFSGEGPDELFGGYETYRIGKNEQRYRKVPLSLRKLVARIFSNPSISSRSNKRLSSFLQECACDVEQSFIGQAQIMTDQEADAIVKPAYASTMDHTDITAPIFRYVSNASTLDKKQYLDLNLWAPYDNTYSLFLIGRHFGLDVHTPFLNDEVSQTALALKEEYRAMGMRTKIAFRKAAEDFLPQENCDRPKMSMPLPFDTWFRSERYLEELRRAFSQPAASEFFDENLLMQMLDDHRGGKKDNARKLFTIYCFLAWHNAFFN